MTQAKDPGLHTDALLARYHAAQVELDAHQTAPSAQVRANILAHAQQVALTGASNQAPLNATDSVAAYANFNWAIAPFGNKKPAANDSQWKIRALASVAMLGITGLLFLQWDRGTPEEKEVAFSMERPAPVAKAPVPVSVPSAPPPAAPSAAMADAPVVATTPVAAAPVVTAPRVAEAATPPSKPAPIRPQAPANPPPSKAHASPPATTPMAKPVEAATEVLADRSAAPAATAIEPTAPGAAKSLDSAANAPQSSSMEAAPTRLMAPNAALFAAIREADAASLQLALSRGADKNAKSNGTPAITLCLLSNQTALVQQLAAAGADMNAPDAQGMSPLAHAQAKGLDEMVKLLLELGAK
jgi:hypothetical protein